MEKLVIGASRKPSAVILSRRSTVEGPPAYVSGGRWRKPWHKSRGSFDRPPALRVLRRLRMTALLVLLAISAHAQMQEQITVERVLVDARVTDDHGNPITGLKAGDFQVRIDGKQARVESAEWIPETAAARELASIDAAIADVNTTLDHPAPHGRLLIFFYQTDFARNESRLAGQMQTVVNADDWLDWLDPEDRVAVFSFDSHLKFRLDFTNNKDHIKDAMKSALYTDDPPPPRMVPMPALASRLDAYG